MKKATTRGMLRTLATRSVIAALPVAMVGAYATNMLVPTPPRIAAYEYQQVAEITVSPSTVGVAVSPLYGQTRADIDAQLDQMQALGVENIRVFVPWSLVEFNPVDAANPTNQYVWQYLDEVMDAAAERNMGVMAEINSTPYWAAADGTPSYNGTATPDPAAFAAFMQDFVAHTVNVNGVQTSYASIVSAYEIWNEPNAVLFSNPIDPAAYAALVKAAYQVIKPADPTATVVAGAVGHVINFGSFTMDPVDFVNAMIAADPDIRNYFDALSYHPYDESLPFSGGNLDPATMPWAADTAYNQVKELMALVPGKKVWISEFGVPTYTYTDTQGVVHTVSQQTQRDYIADLLEHWDDPEFMAQAGPIFLYTGRDTATGSTNPDANYGLWTQDGTEKQVIYDYLRDWLANHPQNPDDPTDPPDPIDPIVAALQAFVTQIANAIANAVTQALVQTLGQQIANAIVNAIAQALASIGIQPPPAPVAAPLSLRVASVESSEATTAAAEADSTSATEESAKGAEGAAAEDPKAAAAEEAAATPAAAEATATEPTVAATEPVKATEPVVATETPATTEPTTTPASTESTATEKPADTPSASDPKSDESTTKSDESDTKSDDADKKSGEVDKDKKSGEAKSGSDSEAKSKGGDTGGQHRKHGSGDELKVKVGAEGADGSSAEGGGES
jgi:hypothetical protein